MGKPLCTVHALINSQPHCHRRRSWLRGQWLSQQMKWKKTRFGRSRRLNVQALQSHNICMHIIHKVTVAHLTALSINHTKKPQSLLSSQCTCAMFTDFPQVQKFHTECCQTSLIVGINLDSLLRTIRRTRQGQISDVPVFFIHFRH